MTNPLTKLSSKRSQRLWVTEQTHKKTHKRKLDLKTKGIKDIDDLINHLLEVEKEVNKRK
jgi:hypothetical protein